MDEANIFASFIEHNKCLSPKRVAVYGTGKYAHRFANEQDVIPVVCYLDKEKKGEFCNKPIMSLEHAFRDGVDTVIIAASKYNEIVIYDRIKDICQKNSIDIYGVHYGELTKYVGEKFVGVSCHSEVEKKKYNKIFINWENTILYNVFFSRYHFFRFLEMKAVSRGICFPNLALVREQAETLLESKRISFNLDDVYNEMKVITKSSSAVTNEIKTLEEQILSSIWKQNTLFLYALKNINYMADAIIIENKSCYSDKMLRHLFETVCPDFSGAVEFLNTCSQSIDKEYLSSIRGECRNLFISYDQDKDELHRRVNNTDVWVLENDNQSNISDSIKDFLNNSYYLNTHNLLSLAYKNIAFNKRLQNDLIVNNIYDFTYLYLAPLISTYVIWLIKELEGKKYDAVLFAARDGFLIKELYDYSMNSMKNSNLPKSIYFYTSRKASIKAGIFDDDDVSKVCKYLNKEKEDIPAFLYQHDHIWADKDKRSDLKGLSDCSRKNYHEYFVKNGIDRENGHYAFCDLISSGTSQNFLQKHFSHQLDGYYLAYYISKLGALPVKALYPCTYVEHIFSDGIRNILESILTSLEPSVVGFDDFGKPVFSEKVPDNHKLEYISVGQKAVRDFYREYWEKLYCIENDDLEYMLPVTWVHLLRGKIIVDDSIFDNICLTEDMFKKEISLSFVEA